MSDGLFATWHQDNLIDEGTRPRYITPDPITTAAETAWQADGLCRQVDPELFFQEPGGNVKPAKQVCMGCDIKARCLEWAIEQNEPFGILGGLTEDERREYRNLQRRNATKNLRRAVAA